MVRYILLRLLGIVPVLLLISIMVFTIVALIPGDAAMVVLGEQATAESLAVARDRLGLDQPIYLRYLTWLGRSLQGDFGESILSRKPVTEVILSALPVTIQLAFLGSLLGVLIAFPVGIYTALRQGKPVEKFLMGLLLVTISVPTYWSSLMLILLFAVQLQWLPASGYIDFFTSPKMNLQSMAMPVLTVGLFQAAILARFVRSGMLEVLSQDYMRTAKAKGLGTQQVVRDHALKNMLVPVVTFMGVQVGALMSGLVITEEIFALPGIGRLALNAISNRDYLVVQGVVLFVAVAYVFINLFVDILYVFLDPRMRY